MTSSQPHILGPLAAHGQSKTWRLTPGANPRAALLRLHALWQPAWGTVGIGEPLALRLKKSVPGLRPFPVFARVPIAVPSTQQALWVLLLGPDRGEVFDHSRQVDLALEGAFELDHSVGTFKYKSGNDLTGYEDGTENPKGKAAARAAICGGADGIAGSSYVAVQRWVHDHAVFERMKAPQRDAVMGRRLADNEEIEDAPESAHVKRAAQEDFDPVAFMIRRSMPWEDDRRHGLEFIAYGETLDRYERVLHRMLGLDDGIVDGLFSISRPITGGYYWCPPVRHNKLDLRVLGFQEKQA